MRAAVFAICVLVLLGSCKSRKRGGPTPEAELDAVSMSIRESVDDDARADRLLEIEAEMVRVTEGFFTDAADARIRMFRRNANYDAKAWDFEKIHREVAVMRQLREDRLIELAMQAREAASETEWTEIAKRQEGE